MLYFIKNQSNVLMVFIFLKILNHFPLISFGFSWSNDNFIKTNINEAFLNMYHVFWVNPLYLNVFYFTVFLIFLHFNKKFTNLNLFFILYFVYLSEFFNILFDNLTLVKQNPIHIQMNTLLSNNLNKVHPFIFYTGTLTVFSFFITSINSCGKRFYDINFYLVLLKVIRKTSLLILSSLFLGSWWALQEGTWGGWWNWDSSETFGLLFFLIPLFFFHNRITIYRLFSSQNFFYIFSISYVFFYLFIQLNFDLVSHNFGIKFFQFFSNKIFFYNTLFLIFTYNIFFFYKNKKYYSYNHTTRRFSYGSLTNLIPNLFKTVSYSLIIVIVFLSFLPLINFLLWNLTYFNVLNLEVNNFNLIFLWVICFIQPFLSWKNLNELKYVLLLFTFFNPILFFLYLLKVNTKLSYFMHKLLISFLVINTFSYYIYFIFWCSYSLTSNIFLSNSIFNKPTGIYSCDYFFINTLDAYKYTARGWVCSWNFFFFSNTPSISNFLLIFSNLDFVNIYKTTSFINPLYFTIDIILTERLVFFFLLFFTIFTTLLVKKGKLVNFY